MLNPIEGYDAKNKENAEETKENDKEKEKKNIRECGSKTSKKEFK